MADGSIRIKTKLDTQEARVDLAKLEKECGKTAEKVKAAGKVAQEAFTGLSTGQLNNAFQRVNKDLEKINAEIAKLDQQIGAIQAETDSMLPYAATDDQAANLLAMEEMETRELIQKRDALTAKAAEYNMKLQTITAELEKQSSKQNKYQKEVDQSKNKTQKLGDAGTKAGNKIEKGMNNSKKSVAKLGNSIKNGIKSMGKMALACMGIRAAFGAVRRAANAYMEDNQALQQQMTSLWNIAGQAIGPFIEKMVQGISTVVVWVNSLIKALTGVDLVARANAAALKKQASATKEAAKAAQLAGFDEMNKLSDNSSASGGSTGAGVFDASMAGDIPDIFEEIKKKLLAGDFFGAGETLGNAIMDAIDNIDWDEIGGKIGKCLGDALGFAVGFATSLDPATIFNSMVGFLGGLTEGLAAAIQKWDWGKVGEFLADALITGILMGLAIYNPAVLILYALLSPNGEELASGAAELIGSIIGGLARAVVGMGQRLGEIGKGIWEKIVGWFDDNIDWGGTPGDIIEGLLDGILRAILDIGAWIEENIFDPFIEGFKKAFGIASPAKEMKPLGASIIDGVKEGIGNIWEKVKDKFAEWKTNIAAWFTTAKENFKNWGSDLITNAKTGIGNIWSKVSEKFTEWKTKLTNWFTDRKTDFKNWGSNLITNLGSGIGNIWSKISDKFNDAKTKMGNWGNTLKNTAKETGEKFVNGLKNGLDTLKSKLKDPINAMIGIIEKAANYIVDKLNTLSFKVPSWVPGIGGNKFGFNLSRISIPRLAKGGIVNNPGRGVLATIGEAGKEAVLPLENNTEWMDLLADKINAAGQKIVVPIYLNGRKIAEEVIDLTNKRKFATNGAF